jgi:hypothetical protein
MVGGLTVSIVLCFIPSIAFSFADPPATDNVQSGLVSIIVALIGSGVVAALINSKVNTSIQKSKEEFDQRLQEFKHKLEFEFEYDLKNETKNYRTQNAPRQVSVSVWRYNFKEGFL